DTANHIRPRCSECEQKGFEERSHLGNFEFRIANFELEDCFKVRPILVKIARSSVHSLYKHWRSWRLPIAASSHNSSQYWVSAASFSAIPILCAKSFLDSARFASL